ncbi:MAG: cysteine desulfurase family protein [Planctomycetota bacterium]
MIYLDHAASSPMLPEVRAVVERALEESAGNPSSPHAAGRRARRILEDARERAAEALGADPREVVFTSGATEANHLAVIGAAEARRDRGDHVVVGALEHASVLEAARRLAERGFRVTRVPVGREGLLDPAEVARAVTARTVLVSVAWVDAEVGALQAIEEIRRALPEGVLLHSDGAQAAGRVAVDVRQADLVTFSAHKMGGPKGAGALWVRRGVALVPLFSGGGQELERRAGTENVPGAAGLAEALRLAVRDREPNARRMEALRERLREGLERRVGGMRVHGPARRRAPHLLNVSFEGVEGEAAVLALDAEGVCAGSGSPCASGGLKSSAALGALGLSEEEARGSVRLSVSAGTTEEEIDRALEIIPRVIERLRRISAGVR